jgi:hypothetical protein
MKLECTCLSPELKLNKRYWGSTLRCVGIIRAVRLFKRKVLKRGLVCQCHQKKKRNRAKRTAKSEERMLQNLEMNQLQALAPEKHSSLQA